MFSMILYFFKKSNTFSVSIFASLSDVRIGYISYHLTLFLYNDNTILDIFYIT
jgi:hypothetical protein